MNSLDCAANGGAPGLYLPAEHKNGARQGPGTSFNFLASCACMPGFHAYAADWWRCRRINRSKADRCANEHASEETLLNSARSGRLANRCGGEFSSQSSNQAPRAKFNCGQHPALVSLRACCPLCARTRSGRRLSGTSRSSGPPRKTSRPASAWRARGCAVTRTAPGPFTRSAATGSSSSTPRCPRPTASPRPACWNTCTAGCPSPRPSSWPAASTRTAGVTC